MRKRQAARVFLFNPLGEILLVHFAVPRRDGHIFVFWAAPGGEIEDGETPIEAAHREIIEELGLDLALEGPVWVDHNSFEYRNEIVDNTDFYFRAECPRDAPKLIGFTAEEIKIMKEIRWWSVAEIETASQAGEKIFPAGLTAWVHKLQSRRLD